MKPFDLVQAIKFILCTFIRSILLRCRLNNETYEGVIRMEVQLLCDLLLRRSIFSLKNMYIPFFHYMFNGSEQCLADEWCITVILTMDSRHGPLIIHTEDINTF